MNDRVERVNDRVERGLAQGVPLHAMEEELDREDNQTVRCPFCGRIRPDPYRQLATCSCCGASPLPSRAYPRDCCFHPHYGR